jgi:hypothetical protein
MSGILGETMRMSFYLSFEEAKVWEGLRYTE